MNARRFIAAWWTCNSNRAGDPGNFSSRIFPCIKSGFDVCSRRSRIPFLSSAISLAVERLLHTQEVAGSIPASRRESGRRVLNSLLLGLSTFPIMHNRALQLFVAALLILLGGGGAFASSWSNQPWTQGSSACKCCCAGEDMSFAKCLADNATNSTGADTQNRNCACAPCIVVAAKTFTTALENSTLHPPSRVHNRWQRPSAETAPARFSRPPVPPPKSLA